VKSGVAFLHQVMENFPDSTRMLLTGDPGRDSIVAAVNNAQIFRYLTKPCAPDQLKQAVQAAVIQNRLVHAERLVLQETLIGCIQVMMDVLALTSPLAFGRANRLQRLVMEFAATLNLPGSWQLNAAALLSQLGYLSLPDDLISKLYYGETLTSEEKTLTGGISDVATRMVERIPRLEPVIQILVALKWSDERITALGESPVGLSARILGLVDTYDRLTLQGFTPDVAVQTIRSRQARYGKSLVDQFATYIGVGAAASELHEMPLRTVKVGMVIMQDLRTHMGTLLAPSGFGVTKAFLERMVDFGPDLLNEKFKVLVPAAKSPPLTESL
jgi:response regulator RpfG family c-di-GMP phosphodiesterase